MLHLHEHWLRKPVELCSGCGCAIKGAPSTSRLPFASRPFSRAVVSQWSCNHPALYRSAIQVSTTNMLLCRVVLALLLLVLLHYCQAKDEGETTQRGAVLVSLTENMAKSAGSQLVQADPFISRNQKQCFETRSLVSCIKYKTSKLIWKLATNSMGFFPSEYGRDLAGDRGRWLRLVQLGEPADEVVVFNDAKSLEGGSAQSKVVFEKISSLN